MSATPTPRVFTIASGNPFLPTLARALVDGTLIGSAEPPDPLTLADSTVYLPTRRAARALGTALCDAMACDGVLLPHLAALGSAGEDDAFDLGTAFASGEQRDVGAAPVATVSALERRLVLADITLEWARTAAPMARSSGSLGPDPVPRTPAEAVAFARELERLFDHMSSDGIDADALAGIIPNDMSHLARNWEINLTFLIHAMRRWQAHLAARGLVDQVAQRDAALRNAAQRLSDSGSTCPVIAAGSTGSVPATAELLRAIAHLPNGAVVLPGLDQRLDSESWDRLGPDHPQYGLKVLLAHVGVDRHTVHRLGEDDAITQTRRHLFSEITRPAETADRWAREISAVDRDHMAASLSSVHLVDAVDEHQEARAIAMMLRAAAEDENCQAALVTPDRALARRVAAELSRWHIAIDDSAGQPLALSRHGAFLRLIVDAAIENFSGERLLALLKHPLCRLGLAAGTIRRTARVIELAGLRGVKSGFGAGLAALADTVRAPADDPHSHPAVTALSDAERAGAAGLLDHLADAAKPLTRLFGQTGTQPLQPLLETVFALAETLGTIPSEEDPVLWTGSDGEAMAMFAAELLAASSEAASLRPTDLSSWLDTVMHGAVVRDPVRGTARIAIWGPLEARLQTVDFLILGGLNEDTWPAQTRTDPWLGRNMRSDLGLEPPERRIGLQAHDFVQAVMAPRVVLTRAAKAAGTPCVPARWIWRMRAVLMGLGLADALTPDEPWLRWTEALDSVSPVLPCPPPRPAPPVAARPTRLSVTAVETLVRDPYAIYARRILEIEPMPTIHPEPDASDYGLLVHTALGRLIEDFPRAPLPDEALDHLLAIGASTFSMLDRQPGIRAYWWNRFERIAHWFIASDANQRAPGSISHTEISGRMDLPVPGSETPHTLTARADRIDIDPAGAGTVVDYKTGAPPSAKEIAAFLAPQLPLEAALLLGGGFTGIDATDTAGLAHVVVSGRDPAGRWVPVEIPADELAREALGRLQALLARYASPETPYLSRRSPKWAEFAGPYDHLARVGEWSVSLGRSHVD